VVPSLLAAQEIEKELGSSVAVLNARFVKPLPAKELLDLASRFDKLVIVEEQAQMGGFSSAVLEFLNDEGALRGQKIRRLGLPDKFIEHGPQKAIRVKYGLDKDGIKQTLAEILKG
jgi:1-deoxy-D-xylulose-5-phosphate synthase